MSRKQTKPKKKRHIWRKIFLTLACLFCLAFVAGAALCAYYIKDAPKLELSKIEAQPSTKIYDANGDLVTTLGDMERETISADQVPQQLKDAIVSIEDRRFYRHIGVDPVRIFGAFVSNLKGNSLQGGSTLTQQLIKLSYFSTKEQDQTIKRKIQEAWLSIQLEQKQSKDQILDYYVNKVYMNNQVYGMETAAKTYFGKSLKDLSLAQTALLAGMPQAPITYDPYTHPEEAKNRRDTVLQVMYENGKISKSACKQAQDTPIDEGLQPLKEDNKKFDAVTDNYVTEVIKEAKERTGKDPYSYGMKIYTNLDTSAQKYLYNLVNSDNYILYPTDNPDETGDEMKTAVTVMDTKSGKVLAQIGDRDVKEDVQRGQNLAVDAKRDVGSTVKPFTDYAPAIEYLHYSTGQKIIDEPYVYSDSNRQLYDYDKVYKGVMTLRYALKDSRNVPAAKLFDAVGMDKIKSFLKDGFDYSIYGGISPASSISQEMSTLQLASIYCAFANGGTYYPPTYIHKIEFSDGSVESYKSEGNQAMSEATAYMITDMLKDVVKSGGTATDAAVPGLVMAGKSGTSNYSSDVYSKIIGDKSGVPDVSFVGYTPDYCIAAWTGYSNYFHSISQTYQHNSQKVFRYMMQYMTKDTVAKNWQQPDTVIRKNGELYLSAYPETQKLPRQVYPAVQQNIIRTNNPYYTKNLAEPVTKDSNNVTPKRSGGNARNTNAAATSR